VIAWLATNGKLQLSWQTANVQELTVRDLKKKKRIDNCQQASDERVNRTRCGEVRWLWRKRRERLEQEVRQLPRMRGGRGRFCSFYSTVR